MISELARVRQTVTAVTASSSELGFLQIRKPDGTLYLDQDIDFGATGLYEIFQNVKYILLTAYRSVPLDREFGMDYSMVDKPIPVAEAMLSQEITMKISLYEPRAIFEETNFSGSAIDGKLSPTVVIGANTTDELPSMYGSTGLTPTPLGNVIQLYPSLPPSFLEMLSYLQGIPGPQGPPGNAATIEVGSTTTGAPGTEAEVINIGTSAKAIFNFTIPQGVKGDTGAGINIKGTVPTSASLPTTGNTVGDMWIADDTGHGWSWDGVEWIDVGPIRGPVGPPGTAATIAAGTTTTGTPGTPANVINTGSSSAAVFDFTIPQGVPGGQGVPGTAATIAAGVTTTLSPVSPATVTNSGNQNAATFDFGIPRGSRWWSGTSDPATVAGSLPGDYYMNLTSGDVFLLS